MLWGYSLPTRRGRRGRSSSCGVAGKQPPQQRKFIPTLVIPFIRACRIGLWALSGPRYPWEEEEAEKTMSVYSDCASEVNVLQWSWKEGTRVRVWDAYEF